MPRITKIIFILLFAQNLAFAQSEIGVKLDVGVSSVSASPANNSNYYGNSITGNTTYYNPTGLGGIYYAYHINNKVSLGTELLCNFIQGKQYYVTSVPSPFGNPLPLYNADNTTQNLICLSLPVYTSYTIKKISINVGLQANYILALSGEDKGQAYQVPAYVLETWDNKINTSSVQKFNYGFRVGFMYQICPKLAFELNYYIGVCSFYYPSYNGQWNEAIPTMHFNGIMQLTAGVRYQLFSSKKANSKTDASSSPKD